MDKPLARFIKRKGEKNKINKIKNEKGGVTTGNTEIQKIIREYYKQLNANKMDNLEETNRYLEKMSLPRLNQEEAEIMNHPITSAEIEAVIKNRPKKKIPGPDSFTGQFYETFREELMSIFLKLFQKIAEERELSNSFYEATITLLPEPGKKKHEKSKLQVNINIEHRYKNPQQNSSNRIQQHIKKLIHHD